MEITTCEWSKFVSPASHIACAATALRSSRNCKIFLKNFQKLLELKIILPKNCIKYFTINLHHKQHPNTLAVLSPNYQCEWKPKIDQPIVIDPITSSEKGSQKSHIWDRYLTLTWNGHTLSMTQSFISCEHQH